MVLRPEHCAQQNRNGSHFCQQKPDDGDVDLGCGSQCTLCDGQSGLQKILPCCLPSGDEAGKKFEIQHVTNRVATLNVPVPSYFSARFLGQLFEKHEDRRVDFTHLSYQEDALLHIVKSPFKRAYWTIRSGHFTTSIESTMITIFGWKELCILITHPVVVSLLELFDCSWMRRHSKSRPWP